MGKGKVSFTPRAMELVYQYTQGIPRMINVLADRSLLIAFTMNTKKISGPIIHQAAKDVGGLSLPPSWTRTFWKIVAPMAVVVAGVFYVLDWASIPFSTKFEKDIKKMVGDLPAELPEPVKVAPDNPVVEPVPFVSAEESKSVDVAPPVAKAEAPKQPVAGPITFSNPERLAAYLSSLSHVESRTEAVKWILKSWGLQATDPNSLSESLMAPIDNDLGLSAYEMTGDFKHLIALNYPAILELNLPDSQGTKYLALTEIKNDTGIFGSSDTMELPLSTVSALWNHKAIVFWKDFEKLPKKFEKGFEGKESVWLQKNLRLLGYFQGREAPLYGQKTVDAVSKFQRKNSIKDDGRFDTESKIMLYGLLSIYATPKLVAP
jgi:general secretion pathway protein A